MNFNPKTGISYGYISANELDPEIVEELMYGLQAVELAYQEALKEHLLYCRSDLPEDSNFEELEDEWTQDFNDEYEADEPIIGGTLEGVKYCSSWLGGALHFWVFESPFVGYFHECSLCIPGAANCSQPTGALDGIEGYDVPSTWREEI